MWKAFYLLLWLLDASLLAGLFDGDLDLFTGLPDLDLSAGLPDLDLPTGVPDLDLDFSLPAGELTGL